MHTYAACNEHIDSAKIHVTAYGEHAYIWGAENIKGGFNCCTISAEEWQTSISMYFMDWSANPYHHYSDFCSNVKWVKAYDRITHGKADNLNEYEQEIAAEMIHKGYAAEKDGKLLPMMPVYTAE